MLIVYDKATGQVLDNTGTNSAIPEGPPDDRALVNVPKDKQASAALLRLHDEDDAELVAQVLTNRHHVESGQVVIDGPYPVPEPDATPDPVAELVAAVQAADTVAKVKNALVTHLPRALGRRR